MIFMIDHYDSFTYNIVQYLGELGQEIIVRKNDAIDMSEIEALEPDLIFLSPGPGKPEDTGLTIQVIETFKGKIPIFGVCLGEQALARAYGGGVSRAERLLHGKSSSISHIGTGIYKGLSENIEVMRYHSLIVERENLPDCFEITSETGNREIMGIRHKTLPLEGIQFHPESIGTDAGKKIVANILSEYVCQ